MKIMVFLHGTVIMHKSAEGKTREERVKQVKERDLDVFDYASYIPISDSMGKIQVWQNQGVEIIYLSSHKSIEDVSKDKIVLARYNFPIGQVIYRQNGESYKDIIEKFVPEILIEDDCESIGGESKMAITFVSSLVKQKVKSIIIKEFQGIDHLPTDINKLLKFTNV